MLWRRPGRARPPYLPPHYPEFTPNLPPKYLLRVRFVAQEEPIFSPVVGMGYRAPPVSVAPGGHDTYLPLGGSPS
jgi:hypothetical protein